MTPATPIRTLNPTRTTPVARWAMALTAAFTTALNPAVAQPPPPPPHAHTAIANPLAEVPFEVRLDLAKAYASPLGQMFWDLARQENPELDALVDGLVDTLGLDPRTAIGAVTLRGAGMREMDLELVAELGESTGNLEGFLLTLPGYQSRDLPDGTLLHTFLIDDKPEHQHGPGEVHRGPDGARVHRVWAAMPRGKDGRHMMVATFDANRTAGLAEQAAAGGFPKPDQAQVADQILSLRVEDLAGHKLPPGAPGSAVMESVKSLALALGSGEQITADLRLEISTPARARQVTQLLQGMIALGQLAAIENPEIQPVAEFLGKVRIDSQEQGQAPEVRAGFQSPHAQFEQWLESMIHQGF